MTLVDIARTMLINSGLVMNFRVEVISTACYVKNRCFVRSMVKKTPYELLNDRNPSNSHLNPFGCKLFVVNNGKDNLDKFNVMSYKVVFVGYFSTNKSYRVFNKRTLCVEKKIHVTLDEFEKIDYQKGDHDMEEIIKEREDKNILYPRNCCRYHRSLWFLQYYPGGSSQNYEDDDAEIEEESIIKFG